MELYQLKSFVAVAREKNLTRAAQVIHISQSALSTQIKSLEDELGVQLFVRNPRGMELTQQGMDLLDHAEKTLTAATHMIQEAKKMSTKISGSIKIGMNSDPALLKVTRINRALQKEHPEISVSYVKSQTLQTKDMLRNNDIDIGFIYGRKLHQDFNYMELAMIEVSIVIPQKLAKENPNPDWKEIAEMPWIWAPRDCPTHVSLQKKLDEYGLKPNQATQAVEESIVRELLMDGIGLAMMRKDEALPLVESGHAVIWEQGGLEVPLGIVWMKDKDSGELIQVVIQTISDIWN